MDAEVYTKLTATVKTSDLETASAIFSMLDPCIMVTDYSDAETLSGVYGNLIDESILNADKEHAEISIFLSADRSVAEYKAFLTERFVYSGISADFRVETTASEDWAENWKQYYHPLSFGRITIVPAWEEYKPKNGELIVRMDPGMAFGTGTHETTRLALRYLEKELKGGEKVLDVGTGSGILSIAASRLSAESVTATDLDADAVKNARENVAMNGCNNVTCLVSDLLSAVPEGEIFDFVVANIVADILLLLLPTVGRVMHKGSKIVLSGIIVPREQDVEAAVLSAGFRILDCSSENDWVAFLAELPTDSADSAPMRD